MRDAAAARQMHEEEQRAYESPLNINPTNIPRLYSILNQFLSQGKNKVAYLDGIEYLVSQNDFNSVLRLVHSLNDTAIPGKNYMLVSVDPKTLKTSEYHLLKKESSEDGYGLNLIGELFVERAYVNFAQMLCKSHEGLCITRLFRKTKDFFEDLVKAPDLPKHCYENIKSTPVYWLTTNIQNGFSKQ